MDELGGRIYGCGCGYLPYRIFFTLRDIIPQQIRKSR